MTLVVTHTTVTGAAADSTALVDGPAWDANHTLTGVVGLSQGGTAADLSATGGTGQVLKQVSAGAAVTVGTVAASDIASGAALTRTNDTNVTLTLGGAPTTALLAATSVTVGWSGTLAETRGGTGKASYAVGDLLYADTTTTLAKLADIATGNALISGGVGVAPAWGKIGLSTHISGFGTGVATALAVNVGSAGAPVVLNGALGTPSSGTLTSCTAFTLTTTGSSGAASYSAGTLNVPNYGSAAVVSSLNTKTGSISLSVVKQTFTASGNYTPTTGMVYCVIECVGGGGGGGSAAGGATATYGGGGGGSGGPSRAVKTLAQVQADATFASGHVTVTIGAAGGGGASGSNNGTAGGDTSVGSLCIGKGGSAGLFGSAAQVGQGGAGGVAGTGDQASQGTPGLMGIYDATGNVFAPGSGNGGSSAFGGGAAAPGFTSGNAVAGVAAGNYGGGGSGAVASKVASNAAGGNGSAGFVFITEYVIA